MNSMLYGSPHYGENENPDYRYSMIEIVDEMNITPEEVEAKTGQMRFYINGYTIALKFHYDKEEEAFVVNIIECKHEHFKVFNFETDELRDLIEEKLDLLCHIPEKLSLSEARKRYFNLNK
jgi:hypothetical protein